MNYSIIKNKIKCKIGDWSPYAVVDGRLITGQNPASSEKVAEELL